MKRFVNDPKQFVPEMLKGIALANPGTVKYVPAFNLIMRADAPSQTKVSIIQGSGSGHEPAHVMVVGKGMLDGACPGDVFAAPPIDYVVGATKLLASPRAFCTSSITTAAIEWPSRWPAKCSKQRGSRSRRFLSMTMSPCRTVPIRLGVGA